MAILWDPCLLQDFSVWPGEPAPFSSIWHHVPMNNAVLTWKTGVSRADVLQEDKESIATASPRALFLWQDSTDPWSALSFRQIQVHQTCGTGEPEALIQGMGIFPFSYGNCRPPALPAELPSDSSRCCRALVADLAEKSAPSLSQHILALLLSLDAV